MSNQQQKEVRPVVNLGLLYILAAVTLLGVGVTSTYMVYTGNPYIVDQAGAHLNGATMTNDPYTKLSIMTESLSQIEKIHGNSGWFTPDEKSDIDSTKTILRSVISETSKQMNALDSGQDNNIVVKGMSHKEMNDYINQQIDGILHRMDLYGENYILNPALSPVLYLILIGIPLTAFLPYKINQADENRWAKEYRHR